MQALSRIRTSPPARPVAGAVPRQALCVLAVVALAAPSAGAGPQSPVRTPLSGQQVALSQGEARTPISSLPYTIDECGSYYLTACLTGVAGQSGITVLADDVTIDLNGFALLGVAGSVDGIRATNAFSHTAVFGGSARGWGEDGVDLQSTGCLVSRVQARGNGARGISVGHFAVVDHCVATGNADDGIKGADGALVRESVSEGNGDLGVGIDESGTVLDCIVRGNGTGIEIGKGNRVEGCLVDNNVGNGIQTAGSDVLIRNNVCHFNGRGNGGSDGAGIRAGSENRLEGNHVNDNGTGIELIGGGTLVVRNSAEKNLLADYDLVGAGNNSWGPIVDLTGGVADFSASAWANFVLD